MSPRVLQRIVFGKGVLLLLLCVVHTVAIPFIYGGVRGRASAEVAREFAWWFGALGFYFALLGVIDILASKRLHEHGTMARTMAMISALFAAVTGTLGLVLIGPSPGIVLPVSGVAVLVALLVPQDH